MGNDNTWLIVGGVIAVGGIGFGLYQWWKRAEQAEAAKKLAEKTQEYIPLQDQYNALQEQYGAELQNIITKLNNAVAAGGTMTPEQEADLEAEKQYAAQMEAQLKEMEDELVTLRKALLDLANKANEPPPTLPGFTKTVDKVLQWGLIKVVEYGAIAGGVYFGGKYVKHVIDRWFKGGGKGGSPGSTSATLPNGHVVTGANADEVETRVKQYLLETSPVLNVNAMLVAVPDVRAKFAELPLWVQDVIAADAGILEWYEYPDWTPYLRRTPDYGYALMTALVVIAGCSAISLATLWASTATVPVTITTTAERLAPAFAW